MYGDSTVMRARAGELAERAEDLRVLGEQLVSRLEAAGWTGRAAGSMALRMAERNAELRDAAAAYETAGEDLARHAAAVESLKETIAENEKEYAAALADAKAREARRQASGIEVLASDADAAVLDFTPPPPGHRAWLEAELPGGAGA